MQEYVLSAFILFIVLKLWSQQTARKGTSKDGRRGWAQLITPAGIDMAGRFFKFGLIYIASCMVNNSRFEVDQIRMVELGKAKIWNGLQTILGLSAYFHAFHAQKV